MQFAYNSKRRALESPLQDVHVKFYGFLPERQKWVLSFYGKQIGIYIWQEKIDEKKYKTGQGKSDYRVVNWLLSVGEGIPPVSRPYKFQSANEQDEILAILTDAFSCYDGINERPKQHVEVRLHRILQNRIERGRLLAQ